MAERFHERAQIHPLLILYSSCQQRFSLTEKKKIYSLKYKLDKLKRERWVLRHQLSTSWLPLPYLGHPYKTFPSQSQLQSLRMWQSRVTWSLLSKVTPWGRARYVSFVSAMMVSFLERDHSKEEDDIIQILEPYKRCTGSKSPVYEQRPGKCEL